MVIRDLDQTTSGRRIVRCLDTPSIKTRPPDPCSVPLLCSLAYSLEVALPSHTLCLIVQHSLLQFRAAFVPTYRSLFRFRNLRIDHRALTLQLRPSSLSAASVLLQYTVLVPNSQWSYAALSSVI